MAYEAEISRLHPTALLFLVDQSGSMADPVGNAEMTRSKAQELADVINRLLQNLAIRCAKEEGVRDYFHIGVFGYGANVGPAFKGPIAGRDLVPISEVASSPLRVEDRVKKMPDGAGGLVDQGVKFPTWLDPVSSGGTPMVQALGEAQRVISEWLTANSDCFPPIVLHVTDGESTDGDPHAAADGIRNLSSSDGQVLLFNLHVSSDKSAPITFPDSDLSLPNDYARQLFAMSSFLPAHMRTYAAGQGFSVGEGARGFVFNADVAALVQFFDIGTRTADLR